MFEDVMRLRSYDSETHLFIQGLGAPKIVCASLAWLGPDGKPQGRLIPNWIGAVEEARKILSSNAIIVGAHIAYDLACLAAQDSTLLPLIRKAYREGRIYDILLAQALDAIAKGTLGIDPRTGSELRHPSTNKVTKRYSLDVVADLVLGRVDAKKNDIWRKSYGLLYGIPVENWPIEAQVYPVDDVINPLEIAIAQILGGPGEHEWDETGVCVHCSMQVSFQAMPPCTRRGNPHENLEDLPAQVEAAFAMHLGSVWSLRTDRERVEELTIKTEEKHRKAIEKYQKFGWIRPEIDPETGLPDPRAGSEDTIAIKKAVAVAYGATGKCPLCGGSGKLPKTKTKECRGIKLKGRYQNCVGRGCGICGGVGSYEIPAGETTCKAADNGCDGTGYDLSTAPMLPRSKKDGICADRDVKMESGDDNLSEFGEDEWSKTLTTYLPFLRKGIDATLDLQPNALVASGRGSYGIIHQMPRQGAERRCIKARDGYYLGSTDYAAGELCSLSQITYLIVGASAMRDVINETLDPGSLHTALAAQILGLSFDEVRSRVKAGDKQAKDFRQAAKSAAFGYPGGLGSATLVLTNRKKSVGFTKSDNGPSENYDGERGWWGIRFCVMLDGADYCGEEKIVQWNGRKCPPVCKRCVAVADAVLKKSFFKRFPEVREYLNKITEWVDKDGRVPQYAWNSERGEPEILRWRGGVGFCDGANTIFQGLLADINKRAYARMTWEGYLGTKEDGSPSPLAGTRFPVTIHDESISEIPIITSSVAGPRIGHIMEEDGRRLAPDVHWKADTALMLWWDKLAEPTLDENGNLILWTPKQKKAA